MMCMLEKDLTNTIVEMVPLRFTLILKLKLINTYFVNVESYSFATKQALHLYFFS